MKINMGEESQNVKIIYIDENKYIFFKYFLWNSKMYFMSMCILTCEMFCLYRSSLSSFHHNTHIFEPFLILYKFLFFLFHFLIINIALSLCYLVVTSRLTLDTYAWSPDTWLTRRFVTSRDPVSSFKMTFSRVQVRRTHLSQYRIQLTVEISGATPRLERQYEFGTRYISLESWTVERVVLWACVKRRVTASPRFHLHSVPLTWPSTNSSEIYLIPYSHLHPR